MTQSYDLGKVNFLLVDDNKHMLSLVKSILIALGAKNIVEAIDGEEAVLEMQHFPADIVICDWQMTPMNGIDFTKNIRTARESPNRFVPIIMLSAHTELNRIMAARDVGIHEYLTKPISAHTLYSRIVSIIDHPRPFVRMAGLNSYFGPDRRRKDLATYSGPERRNVNG